MLCSLVWSLDRGSKGSQWSILHYSESCNGELETSRSWKSSLSPNTTGEVVADDLHDRGTERASPILFRDHLFPGNLPNPHPPLLLKSHCRDIFRTRLLSFSVHKFWHSCFECATNIPEHVNTVLFPGYNQNPWRRRLKPELFSSFEPALLWLSIWCRWYLEPFKKKTHSLHLFNGLKIEIWDSQIMGYPYLKTLSKLDLLKKNWYQQLGMHTSCF